MAKKTTETGPSIGYHTFVGTATNEVITDRSIIEATEEGSITYTFDDDTEIVMTVLAGSRYALSPDIKSVSSSMIVHMF